MKKGKKKLKIAYDRQNISLTELNLFPFDDYAFPFQTGVRLKMHSYPSHLDYRPPIAVPLGEPGKADSGNIAYYGTVRKVGEEYWMWYLGSDDSPGWYQRLCLAVSKDGKIWEKPDLGVCEYKGNTHNNLCDFPLDGHIQACVVFYDPDDPDEDRRFKMNFESPKYQKYMCVAFSPDGIHWKEYEHNPVGDVFFEHSGGMKREGVYYVTGQGDTGHYSPKGSRTLSTYCSRDFIHWTPASCQGFTRESLPPKPTYYGGVNGSQVHLGAGLWDRGNVIIGFYGMWEGHPSNDRNLTCMNLGMVISHDGLHYYEPVPNFPIILGSEMKNDSRAAGHFPALMQGQGAENIGNETIVWFGLWPEADSDGVRAAIWGRDRFGHMESYVGPDKESFIVSDRIWLEGKSAKVRLNIGGISDYSKVSVSVLDEDFNPISGYSKEECCEIMENGFAVPVCWQRKMNVYQERPIRIRVDFEGIRPEDVRLYGVYLEE